MNSYASQYPVAVAFDPAYTQFFERFYATSDTPEAHEDYVKYFTQDATLIMASKKVVGPEGAWSFAFFIEPCDETSPPSDAPKLYFLFLGLIPSLQRFYPCVRPCGKRSLAERTHH
jgi:hypothetical protein